MSDFLSSLSPRNTRSSKAAFSAAGKNNSRVSNVPSDAGSPRQKMRYGEVKEKKGYLRKEGRTLKLKTRRFLTLTNKTLSHHKDEQSPPSWSLDVAKISALAGPRHGELLIIYEGRTVSFFTQDIDDLADWIRVLKAARSKLEDWYTVGKEIGRGSYGTVYAGEDRETKEKVAIKVIQKNPSSRRQTKFLEREVKILKSVDSPHVIVTLDVFEDEKQVALVSEFMQGGELFDRIIADKAFTEGKARAVTKQILLGIDHLHGLQVVHRDIKPENVLCTSTSGDVPHVKLTDFGLSNVMDDGADTSSALLSHVGTSFYLAPEVVGREGYGPGVDLWAAGVVLYIMLCGRFPFWGKTDIEYLSSLRRGPDMRGDEWTSVSDEGKQFVRTLLEMDPKKRPNAKQALKMSWILSEKNDGGINRLESHAGLLNVRDETNTHRKILADAAKAEDGRIAAELALKEAESPVTPTANSFTGFDSD